ncbi:coiled-coil domain-containing protein 80 [Chanos chanos]|uniref:Coiled-coil domain-containing protein 80 n=1 Tax=Chanos chanos TaxID=29144 RepID=A0A6J2V2X1_CHACN|nr:coiled-coil domain-containing protein 80-like [Chanos chanos]
MPRLCVLLVVLLLWSSSLVQCAKRTGKNRNQSRARQDSTDPQENTRKNEARESYSGIATEPDFLADFAGKKRLWVITASSYNDNYLRMMEKQIEDMKSEGLNCRLAERDTLIVTIIQNAMMEGKIQHSNIRGEATVETMDTDMVTKLLHYLELEDQTFSMLILKKNLRVSERFPYPVRVEAILETIDQLPLRKLEKVTRKGSPEKCKFTKKRLVVRKPGPVTKKSFSSQRRGNTTYTFQPQRKPLDKKVALRNKVQDILNGRSRFVIRKTPTHGSKTSSSERTRLLVTGGEEQQQSGGATDRDEDKVSIKEGSNQDSVTTAEKKRDGVNASVNKTDREHRGEQDRSTSESKGKGKKDGKKKGKGRKGKKKSQREANDKERRELKDFLEKFKGKRRLLVMFSPSDSTSQYVQQKEDIEQRHCDFALRKVSVLSILGAEHSSSLQLQHYQLDTEPTFDSLPDMFTNSDLVDQIRKEYGAGTRDLSMVVTDYDLKPTRVFHLPATPSVLINYIDSFPSRRSEKDQEKKAPQACSHPEPQSGGENSLLRFMSKRRLLIISTPSEDDYLFQQQLQALKGQKCPMGIRHFAMLKLVGAGPTASGSVELFPLNGKSQTEKEPLSQEVVKGLSDQLKINRDFFSMLVVGKDGDVKAWFPSPMWSLSNIYELVDSMELRQQEEKLQRTLGIGCLDEGADTYHGYQDETDESYLYRRSED